MIRWAIISNKGGVGKTTTTVNLAAALGELGHSVLVVDMDPRCDASARWFGVDTREDPAFLRALAGQSQLLDTIADTNCQGVQLIPGSRHLENLRDLRQAYESHEDLEGFYFSLRRELDAINEELYDFVLIDCPPSFGLQSTLAMVACDLVMVPVQANVLGIEGLVDVVKQYEATRDRINPALRLAAVVVTLFDPRTRLAQDVHDRLWEKLGEVVYDTRIRRNVRLEEAPGRRMSIIDYAPSSNGAADYRALAQEFVTRQQ